MENEGMIVATSNGQKILIKFSIKKHFLKFSFNKIIGLARLNGDGCHWQFKDKQEKENINLPCLKTGIRLLVDDRDVNFQAGTLTLGDKKDGLVYEVAIIPNGFILTIDVRMSMDEEVQFWSFGVIWQDRVFHLAKQQGFWDVTKHDQQVVETFVDYYSLLERVRQETWDIYQDIVAVYEKLGLVN